MTIAIMILCSLFISFVAMGGILAIEIYDVKKNRRDINVLHLLAAAFLSLIPMFNVFFLVISLGALVKQYLSDHQIIESINKYLTKLVKGEKE